MPNKASEFFGEEFGEPVQTQAAPKPQEEKGMVKSALEFFGMDFSAPPPKAKKTPKSPITDGTWDEINKKYAAEHGERESARLTLLEGELKQTKDPETRKIVEREIKRLKKNG